ncbi:uncharacterized protein [Parasteatoda tepidariorum]|nr:protein ANTAGONIST OF LIKE HETEROCHROMATIN PROTEIN 1 [Parasteatoda tepidariorum]
MVNLNERSISLLHNIISCYFKKRRKTKSSNSLNRNLYFYQSLRKYNQLRTLYHQHRILFMKSLINTGCFLHHRKYFNKWWEKIQNFTDDQWLKYLRMRKETFALLVSHINPYLQKSSKFEVSVEKQIALALIFLSSGKSYRYLSRLFSVSKIDIQTIVTNVCSAIKHLMPKYLKIPSSTELKKNISDFQAIWGFPQCAGVLGSMHIPLNISHLPHNAVDYFNSNSDYSMLLQCIVDANYKFWDINVGWPGNVPESRILTNSTLWLRGQDRKLFPEDSQNPRVIDVPLYILAGAAYPLSHWILKPFLNDPESDKEKAFNEKFTFAYNVCEIAMKRLKARWNCLVKRNIHNVETLPSAIAACCILHNFCEINQEPILDKWILETESFFKQPVPSVCSTVIGPQAETIRHTVCEYVSECPVNDV